MRALRFCSVLLLTACGGSSPSPEAATGAKGATVSFSLPSDDGTLVTIPSRSAKTTVVDFFAPTCEPCKKRVPELLGQRAALESKGARVLLVGVLSDSESTDTARRALASWGAASPFLVDHGDTSKAQAGVTALPTTLVLDASGHVLFRSTASSTVDDAIAAVP